MGSFYLGAGILISVAAIIAGLVVYKVGFLLALVVFGGAGLITGAIYLGIHLMHG